MNNATSRKARSSLSKFEMTHDERSELFDRLSTMTGVNKKNKLTPIQKDQIY